MIRDVKYPRQPTVAFRGCKAEIAKAKAWDVSSYQLNEENIQCQSQMPVRR